MTPDLIVTGGRIRTMDRARPFAEALAIRDGRILALGTTADILALAGPGTRRIDASGRLVLPAFMDAHTHLQHAGVNLVISADLYTAGSLAELQGIVRAHAARVNLPLILGAGWQPGTFTEDMLNAAALDAAVPDRPCILYDSSFHNACINTAAIQMIGLTADTPDPLNGHFVRDQAGRATGMLHERATRWAADRLPDIHTPSMDAGLDAAMRHANALGITGVVDALIDADNFPTYQSGAASGRMTLRVAGAGLVTAADTVQTMLDRLTAWRDQARHPEFKVNTAKFFLDGVFENRTAAMLAPYSDPPGGNAPLMFSPEQIAELFPAADAARFQIHIHAIGDAATHAALDGFEEAIRRNGRWPSLHQIAHLEVVAPEDFARMARLGVMANIQPLWARYDPVIPDIALDMIGPQREPFTYAFRRMIDAGASIAMGSDWPVSTINPFQIIETAVTRRDPAPSNNKPVFHAAECLTVAEAVEGYTTGAAAALWQSGETGRLAPGYSADVIVLDRDIYAVPPDEIGDTEVQLTLFRGAEVHRHQGFGG